MTEQEDHFQIKKPVWKPKDSAWWLTIASGIAAAILLLFPALPGLNVVTRIIVTILIFVGTPLLLYCSTYAQKWLSSRQQKVSNYDDLYEAWLDVTAKLLVANKTILKLSLDSNSLLLIEIERVLYFRNKVHLILTKVDNVRLQIGQEVFIIDANDGLPLGHFVICENRSDGYVAKVGEYIDALWLGYVVSTGESEMRAPVGSVAIVKKGVRNENA